MSAYLISSKEIKFNLDPLTIPLSGQICTNSSSNKDSKRAQIISEISTNTIRQLSLIQGGNNGYQNWLVYSKLSNLLRDNAKKSVLICIHSIANGTENLPNGQLRITVASDFLKDIQNSLGPDAQLKVTLSKHNVTPKPALEGFLGSNSLANSKDVKSFISVSTQPLPLFGGGFKIPDTTSSKTSAPFAFGQQPPTVVPSTTSPSKGFSFSAGVPKFGTETSSVSSSSMYINSETTDTTPFCEGYMAYPSNWYGQWEKAPKDTEFTAELNLLLTIPERSLMENSGARGIFALNKMLLEKAVNTDVEIIAGNDKIVRCHSAFLIAQSEVMHEKLSSTRQITIADTTEQDVNSFLAFLYHRDLSTPLKDSKIAVQLFILGHMYKINELVGDMTNILLKQPNSWFDANSVVVLFCFVRDLAEFGYLKAKTVQVLKCKSQAVMMSPEYNRLFEIREDEKLETTANKLQVLKELCDALLRTPDLTSENVNCAASQNSQEELEDDKQVKIEAQIDNSNFKRLLPSKE